MHRDVPQLAREAARAAQQATLDHDRRADPGLGGDVQEVGRSTAEPAFGEPPEVGLVVGPQRQLGQLPGAGGAQREPQLGGERHLLPAQVGGPLEQCAVDPDQSGHGQGQPGRTRSGLGGGPADQFGEVGHDGGGAPAPVADLLAVPGADLAAQVDHAGAQVLHPDLGAEAAGAVRVEPERGAGAADLAARRGRALLDHQSGPDQLLGERGDRGPGQSGPGGHLGARARGAGDHAEHQRQIGPAHPLLARGPGRGAVRLTHHPHPLRPRLPALTNRALPMPGSPSEPRPNRPGPRRGAPTRPGPRRLRSAPPG